MNSIIYSLKGLFFDGRKDPTLVIEKKDGVCHRKLIQEEHISLVAEHGGFYIGHTAPKSETSADLKDSILNYIEKSNKTTSNLTAIRVDGTVVHTGKNGGVIRLMKQHFKRPMRLVSVSIARKRIAVATSFA